MKQFSLLLLLIVAAFVPLQAETPEEWCAFDCHDCCQAIDYTTGHCLMPAQCCSAVPCPPPPPPPPCYPQCLSKDPEPVPGLMRLRAEDGWFQDDDGMIKRVTGKGGSYVSKAEYQLNRSKFKPVQSCRLRGSRPGEWEVEARAVRPAAVSLLLNTRL